MRGGDAKPRRVARQKTIAKRPEARGLCPRAFTAKRRTYNFERKRSFRSKAELVAPVEISAFPPETFFTVGDGHVSDGLLAGPRRNGRIQGDDRLLAVHRLLEAGLLLGLEERMVVEGVRVLVMPERHRILESRV